MCSGRNTLAFAGERRKWFAFRAVTTRFFSRGVWSDRLDSGRHGVRIASGKFELNASHGFLPTTSFCPFCNRFLRCLFLHFSCVHWPIEHMKESGALNCQSVQSLQCTHSPKLRMVHYSLLYTCTSIVHDVLIQYTLLHVLYTCLVPYRLTNEWFSRTADSNRLYVNNNEMVLKIVRYTLD